MRTTVDDAEHLVTRARAAAPALATFATGEKNAALLALAESLERHQEEVLAANASDLDGAQRAGQRPALQDRLRLNPQRVEALASSVRNIAALEDPVGRIQDMVRRPNGMQVGRMRVPIGVILMIYEARPNVTIEAAALCLKAGNAVILRGGSEAGRSNRALGRLLAAAPFPTGSVQVVDNPDHTLVIELLAAQGIDLVIPRGSEELIRTVARHARMPVIKHFKGVCHLYVDGAANAAMAERLILNAKVSRPATCNALETVLVDRRIALRLLPRLIRLLQDAGVEVRGCAETRCLAEEVVAASEGDWGTEYLDLIVAVRVVEGLDEAVEHIRRYGTALTDGIITNDYAQAMRFVEKVDSAAVLVNASTRLVDGGEFGLGAEIGISTERVGPRGPMGLEDLTTTKWVVLGSGQVR